MRLTNTKWPRWLVPNCVSKPSAVRPNGVAITPALAITTSKGSPFASNASAQARTLFMLARSSSTTSKLPPLAAASLRTCSVAAFAFGKSRAAPTTCAPCAARERAVSTPSPAETPVTRMRFPRKSTPDRTSSVVEVAPNVGANVFAIMFLLPCLLSGGLVGGYELTMQKLRGRGCLEIVSGVEVRHETGVRRTPSELLLRFRAGGRTVHRKEVSDPTKVRSCFFAGFGDHRHVEAAADDLSDVATRDALFGDAMVGGSSSTFLNHE